MTGSNKLPLPAAVDTFKGYTVYALTIEGEIVYVGCSEKPRERYKTHRSSGFQHIPIGFMLLSQHRKRRVALDAERRQIERLRPKFNRVYNRTAGQRPPHYGRLSNHPDYYEGMQAADAGKPLPDDANPPFKAGWERRSIWNKLLKEAEAERAALSGNSDKS